MNKIVKIVCITLFAIVVIIVGFKYDGQLEKQTKKIDKLEAIIESKNFRIEQMEMANDEVYYMFGKCIEDEWIPKTQYIKDIEYLESVIRELRGIK